jgi:hypothetical protein
MKIAGMMALMLGWSLGVLAQGLPATKLTLNLNDVSLAEALKQISQASGNLTTASSAGAPKAMLRGLAGLDRTRHVTLETREEPYWNVIDDLCEKCQLRPENPDEGAEPGLRLAPGNPRKVPVCLSGACQFQVITARAWRDHRYDGDSLSPRLTLYMKLRVEQKMGVVKCSQPIIETALADNGASLAPKQSVNPRFEDLRTPPEHALAIDLNYKPDARSLKTLSGKVWLIQEIKSEDWEINDPSAADLPAKTFCNLDTLKITRIQKGLASVEMEMDVTSNGGEEFSSWATYNRRIQCDLGEGLREMRISSAQMQGIAGDKRGTHYTFRLTPVGGGKVGELKTMVIRLPAEVKAVEVPFEFHDLELP